MFEDFLSCHPDLWENDPGWLAHICQMGRFSRPPSTIVTIVGSTTSSGPRLLETPASQTVWTTHSEETTCWAEGLRMQGWLLVGMGGCDGCLVRFPGKSPGENISPYCYFLFRKVRSKGLWTGLRLIHHISLLSSWAPLALYNSANAVNTITTDRKPTRNHSCNTSCSQWKGNRYFKVGVQENRTRCWWLLFLMRNQEITGIPIESLMLVRNIVLESLETHWDPNFTSMLLLLSIMLFVSLFVDVSKGFRKTFFWCMLDLFLQFAQKRYILKETSISNPYQTGGEISICNRK